MSGPGGRCLPPGEIRFTCGMGRYRGRLELVDKRRAPVLTRLRRRTNLLETPLGTAFVLWICSLPLIALLAVLALDPGSAIAAAGAALGAWVVGCLWAFRRAARPLVAGIALPSGTAANAAAHGGGGGDASSGQAP